MLLRFTSKMAKKLKLPPLTKVTEDPGPFLEWYVNVFIANRVQYILTTEAKSLFSIMFYGRGITNHNTFINQWLSSMSDYLSDIGKDFVFKNIIAPNTDQLTLSTTLNKSVLGSMTDMIVGTKFMLQDDDLSPWELSKMLNETPYKALEYNFPVEVFNQLKYLKSI